MTVAATLPQLYTYTDLAALPEDGQRYELIGGELCVSPAPSLVHQRVTGKLFVQLWSFVDSNEYGEVFIAPTDVYFSPFDTVEPDILFVATANHDRLGPLRIDGAPDLVIEVLSEGSRRSDLIRKQALYATFGVPEYWIVDPATRTITVLTLVDGLYQGTASPARASSQVLSGFEVDVAALFSQRRPLPD